MKRAGLKNSAFQNPTKAPRESSRGPLPGALVKINHMDWIEAAHKASKNADIKFA
jgi:hypothetical protein